MEPQDYVFKTVLCHGADKMCAAQLGKEIEGSNFFLFLKKSYATAIQNVPVRILSGRKGNKGKFKHFIKEWKLAFLFTFFKIYLTFTKTFNMRDLPRKLP